MITGTLKMNGQFELTGVIFALYFENLRMNMFCASSVVFLHWDSEN